MKILALLPLALMVGCAHPSQPMAVHETDSAGQKAGKVALRAVLCPLTLCLSEVIYSQPPWQPGGLHPVGQAILLERLGRPPAVQQPIPVPDPPRHCLGQIGPHGVVTGSCY